MNRGASIFSEFLLAIHFLIPTRALAEFVENRGSQNADE
jgi:hypothetical protein